MKRTILIIAIAAFLVGGAILKPTTSDTATAAEGWSNSDWYTSWDQAAAESKKTGKPILMDFTGSDWCGWCIKLKKEVFDTAEFRNWASQKVVLLEIDFPQKKKLDKTTKAQNERLAKKYDVQGFPTIVFADHTGKAISRYGYDRGGPVNWTRKAEAGWKK